jgi:large subunit ribosomal protein L24
MRSDYRTTTSIRVGDTVAILSGKDAGKRGTVERLVNPGRVVVTGVNISKKHQKPRQKMNAGSQTPTVDKGGILEIASPLDLAKVALVCAKCDRPVRIKMKVAADGQKSRQCSRCAAAIAHKEVTK